MANYLEWYAMDAYWYGDPSMSASSSGDRPDSICYARVVGFEGPVVWKVIWEPMSSGPTPSTWAGGPVSVGQYPTEYRSQMPDAYVPQNSDAFAIGGNLDFFGIVRLSAVAGGVPVPGRLLMTILDKGSVYPAITPGYDYDYTPTTELFWTQHHNTYEIP